MPIISGSSGAATAVSSELFYTELTSTVTISATTEGTAQDVVSSGAQTYTGAAIIIEFQAEISPVTFATTPDIFFLLQDGATVLGRLGYFSPGNATQMQGEVRLSRRMTPTAASHTFKVTAFRAAGNNYSVVGDVGGSAKFLPAYIRILLA